MGITKCGVVIEYCSKGGHSLAPYGKVNIYMTLRKHRCSYDFIPFKKLGFNAYIYILLYLLALYSNVNYTSKLW